MSSWSRAVRTIDRSEYHAHCTTFTYVQGNLQNTTGIIIIVFCGLVSRTRTADRFIKYWPSVVAATSPFGLSQIKAAAPKDSET